MILSPISVKLYTQLLKKYSQASKAAVFRAIPWEQMPSAKLTHLCQAWLVNSSLDVYTTLDISLLLSRQAFCT